MTTHSSILARVISWTDWWAIVHGVAESEMAERLTCALLHMDKQFIFCILNTGTSQVVSG